jgi:L-ascorbate metabolism protein UlaG (beta-lactamase superfamily)
MKKIFTKTLLLVTIICFANLGFSQSNEIKIKFIGNCGLYLTDGKINLYVDFPYKSGAHNYMKYDESELKNIKENAVFLFTHRHSDHYSKKLVRKMKKEFAGNVYGNWNADKLKELNSFTNDFSIQESKTSHKFTFKHYSYLITWHGKKIYLSGDTGDLEDLSKIKNIDWAFINPWIYMKAENEKVKIDAKNFGMYHLYPNQEINGEIPENLIILKKQGEIITIPY